MWLVKTQRQVCQFFDISAPTFRSWQQRGMPGSSGAWPLDEIARWRIQYGDSLTTVKEDAPKESAKEKAQAAKVLKESALLDLKISEKRKALIDIHRFQGWLGRLADLLRRGLDRLQRQCGDDAYDIMSDALDRLDAELRNGLLDDDDEDEEDDESEAADGDD